MKVELLGNQNVNNIIGQGKNKEISSGFDKVLGIVEEMNKGQVKAKSEMTSVLNGESDNTHGALIALEKASLQLQMATTARDKLLQGYQQIINMQI